MVLVIWHHKEEAVLLHKSYNQQRFIRERKQQKKRYSGNTYNISILTHFRNGANLEIQKKN